MLVTLIWCLKVCLPQKYEDTFQNLIGMATCDSLSTSSFFPPHTLTLLLPHWDIREVGNNTEMHSNWLVKKF